MKTQSTKIYYKLATLFVLGAMNAAGQAITYLDESFTGSSVTDWSLTHTIGNGPALTGGSIDPEGQGWLRLTGDLLNQNSFAYYNNPIPTSEGLIFTFDFVMYGAHSSRLADGFALVLFDAAVATPTPGAYGGSLGYTQRSVSGVNTPGLAGGIMGVGFDVFGNYSRASEGRIGGPGQTPHSVAIRGGMGATGMDGYQYITGTGTLDPFSSPGTTNRSQATVHTVRVTLPSDKKVHVEWHQGDGNWTSVIAPYQCELNCPEEIMFGFTAGTGSSSMNQEIRNLSVTSIPEPGRLLLFGLAFTGGLLLRRRCA